ncbi:MAG TPA: bile acid:sodium symporter family protein [Gordonia sp. (in: high G+C Gram-positive bacteria)]|uniref:bile acid:sodium symporter family protein n=1 Tax=unclassified Gordonia (in: high G+C Gram-positive bacteria) TaxID=2657482 RepID=UPI000FA0E9B5|nr:MULTISPECIES: bile acid:sodium symporter family protein [unclassified Gordonia (in: high G+C Gram-positive bacteria)]RUP38972.1 MAG: bile acid:sodium symporter [Gordonia sp. (in: high G+C Gram-positive bacteria)]HNP56413.1 bile acid:sodium symporter family protein [Gordonia sp. (in: high G+C Gram-positive bacteria)]HRC51245.1 bile acid:sodium symporter family protein [Gordonia sp. (in: high G+C Gram-positive bacteria)]
MALSPRALLAKSPIDGFVISIMLTVVVAALFPAKGVFADVMDWVVIAAIALLFFLYGARLHPREALDGLTHWRLHLLILAFTFVVFPIIGVAMRPLVEPLVGEHLYLGLLFTCLVPSTVQSSIAFTSIARGNVAAAIVAASVSSLIGVIVTPLLAVWLMNTSSGMHIDGSSVLRIMAQILLPFLVGQLARPWIADWVARHAKPTKLVDRGSIVLVVYVAFSEGMRNHIWSQVSAGEVIAVAALATALVVVMLIVTGALPPRLGFDRADTIAIQFCGSKKSLAAGLPMATVLFTGSTVGLIVLPLMIFHQIQLILCSMLASRYAKRPDPEVSE